VPPGVRLLPGFHGFTRILCSAATVDRAHGPLLADVDRGHIIRVPPTASSDDILQATSDAGPDLIVWDRESPAIATLVRRATVPVLTVTASGAARARHQPTEECVR
jgi:hypothetical protein